MRSEAIKKAVNFIENETEYHLGFLPVEQSNPRTKYLDRDFSESEEKGVRALLSVDQALLGLAEKTLNGQKFIQMSDAIYKALNSGNKIVFSGCGATGRLSILLESAYRNFFKKTQDENPETYAKLADLSDLVFSIMTGGDYALIRSVEFFEDYQEFGKEQVKELDLGSGDLLIGITATGETTSILGTVSEAVDRGANAFLIICVEEEIPKKRLKRARQVFEKTNVTVIDMSCEPMAIAGSTRMQSTTLEQLIAGAALEIALNKIIQERLGSSSLIDYKNAFKELIDILQQKESVSAIAACIKFEEEIYRKDGLITYYADDLLLDILTDTTERSPTFSLPPFRKCDDKTSAQSLAFAKNPTLDTSSAWQKVLGRAPRCINWTYDDYIRMGVASDIALNPPQIATEELMKFTIGNELDFSRSERTENAAILIGSDKNMPIKEFKKIAEPYKKQKILHVGTSQKQADFNIPYSAPITPLCLFDHLAVKLTMNIISTGSMVKMGKVTGNWMTSLNISNKKLIDRGVRLISELCDLNYQDACIELFTSQEMLKDSRYEGQVLSAVEYTINRIEKRN
jgi:N-acetylmuramic acid 6-phosphate etherase